METNPSDLDSFHLVEWSLLFNIYMIDYNLNILTINLFHGFFMDAFQFLNEKLKDVKKTISRKEIPDESNQRIKVKSNMLA
ncbi:MAG: hypothetical protein ACTSWN_07215 [Promethearchaeota archaeon]